MTQESEFHALVVDDEANIRRLISRALTGEGISSDVAADGAEALSRFDPEVHDLVVTDLRMPNRHGHALIVDLLEQDKRPDIFVLTSVAEPRLVKDLLVRGVQDISIKPVDFKMFAAKVRSRMDAKRAAVSASDGNAYAAEETREPEERDWSQPLDSIEQIESYLISEMTHMPPELLAELVSLNFAGDVEIRQDVKELVARLSRLSPYAKHERRKTDRVKTLFPVQCVTYDEAFNRIGHPFHAFIRDISASGVGIVALRPMHEKYSALGWTNAQGLGILGIIEILRCQAHESLYEIGGQFVSDL